MGIGVAAVIKHCEARMPASTMRDERLVLRMNVMQATLETATETNAFALPSASGFRTRFARWVSILAHPFVMVAILVSASAAHSSGRVDLKESLLAVALFAVLPVAGLTVWQVRRGAWSTVDASRPQERPILYAVGIAGMGLLILFLTMTQPDSILLRGSVTALALLLVCAIVTPWIKVSLHMAAAALTAATLVLTGSTAGWVVAAVLPALAWSRLALGRHQPAEIALGSAFGVVAGAAIGTG
jgi:hypothetical protein